MSRGQNSVVLGPSEGRVVPIGPSAVRLLSVGGDTANLSSVEEIAVPANFGGPPPHFHRATSHSWYVIEGEMTLTVEETSHALGVGGFVYVPAGTPHTFANHGSVAAKMVEFTTPGGFDRYLQDLARAFPEGSEIDPNIMIEVMARHDTFPAGA